MPCNAAFTGLGQPHGLAEGGTEFGGRNGGHLRQGRPAGASRPYINMLFVRLGDGPGLHGHYAGWIPTWPVNAGGSWPSTDRDSTRAPIRSSSRSRQIAKNAMGHGQWDGRPGDAGSLPSAASGNDGRLLQRRRTERAERRARGPPDGAPEIASGSARGETRPLPAFHMEVRRRGRGIDYSDRRGRRLRRPSRARARASPRRRRPRSDRRGSAAAIYGVALVTAENGVDYRSIRPGTARMRAAL